MFGFMRNVAAAAFIAAMAVPTVSLAFTIGDDGLHKEEWFSHTVNGGAILGHGSGVVVVSRAA